MGTVHAYNDWADILLLAEGRMLERKLYTASGGLVPAAIKRNMTQRLKWKSQTFRHREQKG